MDTLFDIWQAGVVDDLEKKYEKRLINQYRAEKCEFKKLAMVNSLSFDNWLPRDVLISIFEFLGKDNRRIATEIVKSHITNPNISTAKNCKMYVEQLSSNSGNYHQFLTMFRQHSDEDQTKILDHLSTHDVLRLFHFPNKMNRTIRDALEPKKKKTQKKSRKKKAQPTKNWMMRDPSLPPPKKETPLEIKTTTKLQRFNDAIAKYQKVRDRNVKQMHKMSGREKYEKDIAAANVSFVSFDW